MRRTMLERAEKVITEFRDKNKEFYGELMFLFHKYINYYFYVKRFSLVYRCLFRIVTDRVREEDVNQKQYNSMKEDVEKIRDKYEDIFDEFSTIVKRHVDMDGIGYNILLRLMYGESVEYILQETDMEEAKRQELRFNLIDKFLDIYQDNGNERFREGITKHILISNLISQSKDYDYDLLRQLNYAAYNLKESSIAIDSEEDIEKTIVESADPANADIEETSLELIGKPSIDEETLNHPDYRNEVIHLEETINEMLQEIDVLESESSEIYAKQKKLLAVSGKRTVMDNEDLNTYSNIQKGISKKTIEIESALDIPYFGRVDFKEDNSNEFESLYIGKIGFKQGSKYGVIDWRMPIASVFYECENGRATYEAPGGIFSGDVKLKRQYNIIDSQLISFTDDIITDKITRAIEKVASKETAKDSVISDPYLLKKLKQYTDKKLKEIIETIRVEQNRIIRQPLDKVLVVQGVAGSGKSTVGLHRISYIIYNFKGIDPGKILVIAPNKVFLDYISDLLPGIDAEGVMQLSFEQLAINIIETDLNVLKDEKVEFFVSIDKKNLHQFLMDTVINVSKFKGSLSFIKLIDYIIIKKANEIISELKDVSIFGGKLKISRKEQIKYLKDNAPLNNKILTLKKIIESRVKTFIEHQSFYTNNVDTLKQEAAAFLRNYLKILKRIEPISIYKELFEDDYVYKSLYKNRYFSFVAQYTLKNLEIGYVEREDLAAICYIKYMTDGISHEKKYQHIFVDEAQDLSPLEFIVLKLVSQNNSMTIMGDMNQGINSHRGIDNWGELINNIYKELNSQYFEISSSYRSTKEIVEFSNKLILKYLPKATPVARDGEKPTIEKISSDEEGINKLKELIKYYKNKGCRSIGILAKKEGECKTIYSELTKLDGFENVNLIDGTTEKYNGGISIVPIALSKGLEFDTVILWNASDENFNDTNFDLKILYVAVTRPMHYLHILYKGNITAHLKKFISENAG